MQTLVARQDLTGADRAWAARYDASDVLRYSRASRETGIGKGEYARVKEIDAPNNRLTVELRDGTARSYESRRQQGVSVYREEPRGFSVGDRIQFIAPANDLKVANRELGTVEAIGREGRMSLKLDVGGRAVELDPRQHPHLDQGYAVTSHSSQGQTAERVLINVDTELGARDLLNNRMIMSLSRAARTMRRFLPTTVRSCPPRWDTTFPTKAHMCRKRIRRTAMHREAREFERTQAARQACRTICDWLAAEQMSWPYGEQIVDEARCLFVKAEQDGKFPKDAAPTDMPTAEIIKRCRPAELKTDAFRFIARHAWWLVRWTYYAFTYTSVRDTALDLALDEQIRK